MAQMSVKDCIRSMENNPDMPYYVGIWNCNDSIVCEFCRSLEGEHYNDEIYSLPQAPFKNCTNADGCRCWMTWTAMITGPPRKESQTKSTKHRSFWDRLRGR